MNVFGTSSQVVHCCERTKWLGPSPTVRHSASSAGSRGRGAAEMPGAAVPGMSTARAERAGAET